MYIEKKNEFFNNLLYLSCKYQIIHYYCLASLWIHLVDLYLVSELGYFGSEFHFEKPAVELGSLAVRHTSAETSFVAFVVPGRTVAIAVDSYWERTQVLEQSWDILVEMVIASFVEEAETLELDIGDSRIYLAV